MVFESGAHVGVRRESARKSGRGGSWDLPRPQLYAGDSDDEQNEVLPRLARELGIADLAQQVEEFRTHPTAEGVNLKGKKRTTLKLFIPNLTFPEPVEMGENVWIYMGELCPAYCLFTPWEETKEN